MRILLPGLSYMAERTEQIIYSWEKLTKCCIVQHKIIAFCSVAIATGSHFLCRGDIYSDASYSVNSCVIWCSTHVLDDSSYNLLPALMLLRVFGVKKKQQKKIERALSCLSLFHRYHDYFPTITDLYFLCCSWGSFYVLFYKGGFKLLVPCFIF